jgi:hypothetical protein
LQKIRSIARNEAIHVTLWVGFTGLAGGSVASRFVPCGRNEQGIQLYFPEEEKREEYFTV